MGTESELVAKFKECQSLAEELGKLDKNIRFYIDDGDFASIVWYENQQEKEFRAWVVYYNSNEYVIETKMFDDPIGAGPTMKAALQELKEELQSKIGEYAPEVITHNGVKYKKVEEEAHGDDSQYIQS